MAAEEILLEKQRRLKHFKLANLSSFLPFSLENLKISRCAAEVAAEEVWAKFPRCAAKEVCAAKFPRCAAEFPRTNF